MADQHGFFTLGDDSKDAPVLRYSIREPITYFFKNIIAISVPEPYFDPKKISINKRTEEINETIDKIPDSTTDPSKAFAEFERAQQAARLVQGGPEPKPPGIGEGNPTTNFYNSLIDKGTESPSTQPTAEPPRRSFFTALGTQPDEGGISAKDLIVTSGSQLYFTEGLYRFNGIKIAKPKQTLVKPQVLIIESYQLSSYRGNYGAGAVIENYSLGPGEKAQFSLKTYEKKTETENEGSCILDSNTWEASHDLELSFEHEQSNKLDTLTADLKNSEAAGGSVSVLGIGGSANYQKTGEWGSRLAREGFAKTLGTSVTKHSLKASSKRNVEVNISKDLTLETGTENVLQRQVENINLSRTLNLVFRQMVQEFFSILHLVDIKLSVYDGTIGPYSEYTLSEIDRMFEDYFVADQAIRDEVKTGILRELYYVLDYQDNPIQFLEKVDFKIPQNTPPELNFKDTLTYWRVKRDLEAKIDDLPAVSIPGVVTNINKITMRTGGVILDMFLGLGEGLDIYSQRLQTEAVREKSLQNDKIEDALKVVSGLLDDQKAEAFQRMLNKTTICCGGVHDDES